MYLGQNYMHLDGLDVVDSNASKDSLFSQGANTQENDLIFENGSFPQELLDVFHLCQRKHSNPHPQHDEIH